MTGRERAQMALLPDGRLHLNDGPIDLIVEASGDACQIERAYAAAASRFVEALDELCLELCVLRSPVIADCTTPKGRIGQRMFASVAPYATSGFITPMAAVAGAVAEEILGSMTRVARLRRAAVNNGGDISFHLGAGESFCIGVADKLDACPVAETLAGRFVVRHADSVRGVATSGWRGRSFSLGIADAVTVLARTASQADAAATVIANAVDLPGHPAITRVPAKELAPDSDLGSVPVTCAAGDLSVAEIEEALQRGLRKAEWCRAHGVIEGAVLLLQGHVRVVECCGFTLCHDAPHSIEAARELEVCIG